MHTGTKSNHRNQTVTDVTFSSKAVQCTLKMRRNKICPIDAEV